MQSHNASVRCVFVVLLSFYCVQQASAQKTSVSVPVPVTVENSLANPVPTVAQGLTPVWGTVTVSNLPLDINGDVPVSIAPDTNQYQYMSIVAVPCDPTNSNLQFCPNNNLQQPIEQALTALSTQGYSVFAVTPVGSVGNGGGPGILYTLRIAVQGNQDKNSRARR